MSTVQLMERLIVMEQQCAAWRWRASVLALVVGVLLGVLVVGAWQQWRKGGQR